jgi:excisionase family DNA binding protein
LPQAEIDTVRQTVVALGVSTGLVYELLRDGRIPAQRPGRRWVIPAPGSTPGSTTDQKAPNQPRGDVG